MDWIMLIIAFILGAIAMFMTVCIGYTAKHEEPVNKVHFYVARDNFTDMLSLHLGKPIRGNGWWASDTFMWRSFIACGSNLEKYGLNIEDYDNLKWEDEPVEVFLNLED